MSNPQLNRALAELQKFGATGLEPLLIEMAAEGSIWTGTVGKKKSWTLTKNRQDSYDVTTNISD